MKKIITIFFLAVNLHCFSQSIESNKKIFDFPDQKTGIEINQTTLSSSIEKVYYECINNNTSWFLIKLTINNVDVEGWIKKEDITKTQYIKNPINRKLSEIYPVILARDAFKQVGISYYDLKINKSFNNRISTKPYKWENWEIRTYKINNGEISTRFNYENNEEYLYSIKLDKNIINRLGISEITSEKTVLSLLGKPNSITENSKGEKELFYFFSEETFDEPGITIVIKDGIVTRIEIVPQMD